ncbi:MAG TPA: NAD(P)/FAD-dependent oxidoreductase [Pyrinomonadaceae bacterium]|nr:NAD(P)/FAD-dependent oxidoreductase [Pyrinomonadaceae bacterium]
MDEFDAIVVGGGPAGASAAIHLALRGARVMLAERERFPRAKLCGEFISPECVAHFARLGVGERMSLAGAQTVARTVFYTRAGRGVDVPSEWFGVAGERRALGLSRARMDNALLTRAREVGVEVVEGATASAVVEDGGVRGVRLQVDGKEHLCRARVTLDATGRARTLARRVVQGRRGKELKRAPLVAFKAHLEGARGEAGACEIYFYEGGYGGLSPVEEGLSNLCFIVRASDARAHASDAGRLMTEVLMRNARARESLAGARVASAWLGVALDSFGRGETTPTTGLLTVGDAASFIDPFTGSGMLMALESGELAAETIARWGEGESFASLARVYASLYEERFGARLRLCGLLRRAAFAPRAASELAVCVLGMSAGLRRTIARATRGRSAAAGARESTEA